MSVLIYVAMGNEVGGEVMSLGEEYDWVWVVAEKEEKEVVLETKGDPRCAWHEGMRVEVDGVEMEGGVVYTPACPCSRHGVLSHPRGGNPHAALDALLTANAVRTIHVAGGAVELEIDALVRFLTSRPTSDRDEGGGDGGGGGGVTLLEDLLVSSDHAAANAALLELEALDRVQTALSR